MDTLVVLFAAVFTKSSQLVVLKVAGAKGQVPAEWASLLNQLTVVEVDSVKAAVA